MSTLHPTVASFDAFLRALPMSEQDIPEGMREGFDGFRRFIQKYDAALVTDYREGTAIPQPAWVGTVRQECANVRPETSNQVPSGTSYMTATFTYFGKRWEFRKPRDRTDSYLHSCSEVVALYVTSTSDPRPSITIKVRYLKRA